MRILFLTPWYPDDKNKNHGIFIREQAVAVSEEHEVVVISSKINYEEFQLSSFVINESQTNGITEYNITIKRSLPLYNQLNYFLISTRVAVKIAKHFKPDIIHGNIGYPGGFWSWLVSRRLGKPFLITEHTFIYNNFRSRVHKKLTLFSLRRANAVITVSQRAAAEMAKYIDRDLQVVPNVVRTERFSIKPYAQGPTVIGFLGGMSSLKHVKGLDTILNVAARIKKPFLLQIGGGGTLLAFYKEQAGRLGISDKCRFLDYIPYDETPHFMNQLHFLVNTSRFESFGIALVEAMAAGVPVVSFDNGGPSDFIRAVNGVLVENQDEEQLKEKLEWMIDNYQNYNREEIVASVVKMFSKAAFVARMRVIYEKALDGKTHL